MIERFIIMFLVFSLPSLGFAQNEKHSTPAKEPILYDHFSVLGKFHEFGVSVFQALQAGDENAYAKLIRSKDDVLLGLDGLPSKTSPLILSNEAILEDFRDTASKVTPTLNLARLESTQYEMWMGPSSEKPVDGVMRMGFESVRLHLHIVAKDREWDLTQFSCVNTNHGIKLCSNLLVRKTN